ncbi:MAG: MCE family protein [Acidimicrobiales bacterium]
MISRRTIINLGVFFGLTLVLIGYGYFSLVQNPLNRPMTLYSYIDDTGGVRPGFTVALRGVPIGHVQGLSLAHLRQTDGTTVDKIKLSIGIDRGIQVPGDAKVQVERANPLGEQQVDLVPSENGTAPPARGGQVLAATSTPTPPDVGQVVEAANRIFAAVPTDDLRTVIHELATAFNGRGADLRTLIEASSQYSREVLAYQDQFKALLTNAPPVLNTIAAVGPQLRDALAQTKALADVLARRAPDLVNLARTSTSFSTLFSQLLDQSTPNLACLIKDLGDVGTNLSAKPQLGNLDQTLLLNTYFFGPVNAITPAGTSVPLTNGPPPHVQTWLRVRTLLPPQQPPAISYPTANRVPDTYPGAACLSQFGSGVPAGAQVGAAAPSEVGKIIKAAVPTVPVEAQKGPTPVGGGTGPGNVSGTAKVAAAAPSGAAPRSGTSRPHPETILFVGGGLAGLGILERRELRRLRRLRFRRLGRVGRLRHFRRSTRFGRSTTPTSRRPPR